MTGSPRPRRHDIERFFATTSLRFGRGALLVVLLGSFACAAQDNEARTQSEAKADLQDFQQTLRSDQKTADNYIQSLETGHDISEMSIGWYIYNLLTVLASQDQELQTYFDSRGGGIKEYLKTTFQSRPTEEIDALRKLAKQQQHPALRQTASYALETLRHIPDSSEGADIQERDRREMARSLVSLKTFLAKSAEETTASR